MSSFLRAAALASLLILTACSQSNSLAPAQGVAAKDSASTQNTSADRGTQTPSDPLASQFPHYADASTSAECRNYLERLAQADHISAEFVELTNNDLLAEQCITKPREKSVASARTVKPNAQFAKGFVNFESAHVHPLDLTPDGRTLLAVNTANHSLEVFAVNGATLSWMRSIAVGVDPITVRARSNTEAWVVNKISDSISIVDLVRATVVGTLDTDNEPGDVVFAANGSKAFVSCSDPNRVLIFNLANLSAAPAKIALVAEKPRAMAVSPDGNRVYVAAFESGNATTTLNGRQGPISSGIELGSENVVSLASSPYLGVNPAPNSGSNFFPAKNPALPNQVSSMIVRKRADGAWTDDNGRNWSAFVSGSEAARTRRVAGWDLSDRDVAVIDANNNTVTYQRSLMNMVMAIGVNPVNGEVTVVGTDSLNEVRYEPNLNGVFLRVNRATFMPGATATISDLNPHLDYAVRNIAPAQRAQSIGDPRGIQWNSIGTRAYVTGMGSNNLIVMGTSGQRLGRVAVGQGPTGVVLSNPTNQAFVLNKFDGSISVVDTQNLLETARVPFFDPTPAVIKAGRPFLYDTQRTSGLGHISCASCHVDARHDRLAWDLGNPAGDMQGVHHPMKGPMMTQSLQDIMRFPNLHWRGDKANLAAFNPAYVSLMGADAPISDAEMTAFGNFLSTIYFPPNPYRNPDNTLPSALTLPNGAIGDAVAGRARMASCLGCHLANKTRTAATNAELSQRVVPGSFHGFYQRLGYWNSSATESTNGFGFFHDGADPLLTAGRNNNMVAAILTFDGPENGLAENELRLDTHAAVGKQLTLGVATPAATLAALNQRFDWLNRSAHLGMVVTATINGKQRAWAHIGTGQFVSYSKHGTAMTRGEFESLAATGTPVTFTLVTGGTEGGIARTLDNANP